MTKYREEISAGEAAFDAGEPRSANPHAYLSTEWYAWDAGWGRASEKEIEQANNLPWNGLFIFD